MGAPHANSVGHAQVGCLIAQNAAVLLAFATGQLDQPMRVGQLVGKRHVSEPAAMVVCGEQKFGGNTLHAGCAGGQHGMQCDVVQKLVAALGDVFKADALGQLRVRILANLFGEKMRGRVQPQTPNGVERPCHQQRHDHVVTVWQIQH